MNVNVDMNPSSEAALNTDTLTANAAGHCDAENEDQHMQKADPNSEEYFLKEEIEAATDANKEVQNATWKTGPETLEEMYDWPERYAKQHLSSDFSRAAAYEMQQLDIVHHEAFAGSGGCGVALHLAHQAVKRQLQLQNTGTLV